MKRLYAAALALRQESGQSNVARLLNASPQTVKNWESRGISQSGAIKAQAVIGCDAAWITEGAGEMMGPAVAPMVARDVANGVTIPVLANGASMGPGSELLDEDVIKGNLVLAPEWIGLHIKPSRADALRFIHGYGDSMAPTFKSGDILLVDTGIQDPRIDDIYVLHAHDRLFIKRVRQRMDGSIEVSSDNPTHKTVDVLNGDSRVEVRGRVVWVWNGVKL